MIKRFLENWLECSWQEAVVELLGGSMLFGGLYLWVILLNAIT